MLKDFLLNIFFPKFCMGCKKEGKYLCENCTLFLSETILICPFCYKPEFFGRTHKKCKKEKNLDGLVSFWDYEGLVKELITRMKKESLIGISKELTEYLFLAVNNNKERYSKFFDFLFDEKTVISYLPIEKKEEAIRGFDEKEEIAKNLAKLTKKKKISLLRKEDGDFLYISSEEVKQVVLVDDIWGSGETMRKATALLKEKGVKKIWGFTFVKTP